MNLSFSSDKEFIAKLSELVLDNLGDENFGVEQLVEQSGLSSSVIRQRLKKISKKTIAQFINEVRLKKALEMLQEGAATASEVAYKAGFSSPTYFNACFHDYFGYTPGEAKKRAFENNNEENNSSSEPENSLSDIKSSSQPQLISFRTIFYAAIAVVAVFILVFSLLPRSGEKINSDKSEGKELKSIVVLPVQNLTGNPENEYVAEVFQTLITDELYRLGFLVRPTHSVLDPSDSLISIQEKTKKLKVDVYLKPTLLCSGDSYCVSVQLYQSIPEEKLLWSHNFEQGKNQVYDIFKNSGLNIAEKINFSLTQQQKDYLSTEKIVDPAFFDTLLVGKHFIHKSNPEDFELGVRKLLKANDLNPLDPAPLLALAMGYSNSGHSSSAGVDATKLSVAYAEKALSLDSNLIDAYVILASYYLYQDWDFQKAENALNRCIDVNPNVAPALYHKGWFLALTGEFDKAADEMKKAMEIDPLDPIIPGYLGWLYQYAEEYEKAIDAAKLTLELDPNYVMGYYVWGTALTGLGKHDEAIEINKKGVAIKPGFMYGLGMAYAAAGQRDKALEVAANLEKKPSGWNSCGLSLIYAQLGDKERTMFWIESMVEKRQDFVPWIRHNPAYKFLRKDKRFQEIVDRLNLPKEDNLPSKK